MLHDIAELCRNNPQIPIFLALAVGYVAGKRVKIFGFSLGTTASVLLAALAIGQIGIEIPSILRSTFFALFIFCIGYKVGPQFLGSLKGDGGKFIVLSLVVAFTALATTLIIGRLFDFDRGTAAGLFAGAMTTSAAIGTAEGAIRGMALTAAQKSVLNANVAIGYAIAYIFGTAGTILLIKMVPKIFGVDLKLEAKALSAGKGGEGTATDGTFSWAQQLDLRAFRAERSGIIGKRASELEPLLPGRTAVDEIQRDGRVLEISPDTAIAAGDVIVLAGTNSSMVKAPDIVGPEVERDGAANLTGETMEVCVLSREATGKTLGELSQSRLAHGVFLRRMTRQGRELPIASGTVIHKCDVLQFIGAQGDVERAVKALGYAERPTSITDLATLATGCVLGTLAGLVVLPIFGLPITLGVDGGILVAGILCGWLRSLHPTFGQIPAGAQWILSDLGLNLFIACVGISAGPQAVQAFQTNGLSIFLVGAVVTTIPLLVALFVGMKFYRMNMLLLLGAISGAHNITAALNTLIEDSESPAAALGYAVPYAFANVLLTIFGSVVVHAM